MVAVETPKQAEYEAQAIAWLEGFLRQGTLWRTAGALASPTGHDSCCKGDVIPDFKLSGKAA